MSQTTTYASLGPLLLARKGGAKPAMTHAESDADAVESDIRSQQEDLARRVSNDVGTMADRRASRSGARRAAFTLRLDPERHTRLKLAALMQDESAQSLVTRALDQYLSANPEIAVLAASMKRD